MGEDVDARRTLIEAALALELAQRRMAGSRAEAWFYTYLRDLFYAPAGRFHRALHRDVEAMLWREPLDDGEIFDSAAIACPRGHGKSTTLAIGLPLWVACEWESMPHFEGRAPYIVIVSDTADQARARLADIRDQLESNEELIARYGWQGPTLERMRGRRRRRRSPRKWTQDRLELANGTIIVAMGHGSNRVRGLVRGGRRPSLILCDDLENDEAVFTDNQREKLRRWFTQALIPTGLEGKLITIVLGTILHADALLSRLLSAEHFEPFLKRRYAALYNTDGMPDGEGTVALWPEYWSLGQLLARRRKIGALAFAQEYLNIPIDDAAALFPMRWLQSARRRGEGRPFLYAPPPRIPFSTATSTWDPVELARLAGDPRAYQVLVTSWDLGLVDDEEQARSRDTDYTVGLTLALRPDDRVDLRRLYRARGLSPAQLRARVISEQRILAADYIVVENNQAQRLHEIELRSLGLPIVGHTTTKRKRSLWDGVPGMALAFETGRLDLCWNDPRERARIDVLINELHGLGFEAHDDTVMALWFGLLTVNKWIRLRNERRRRTIGPAPPGYYDDLFPVQEAA